MLTEIFIEEESFPIFILGACLIERLVLENFSVYHYKPVLSVVLRTGRTGKFRIFVIW